MSCLRCGLGRETVGKGVAVEVFAGQGGEANAVAEAAGTVEELSPLWTLAVGCGEGSPVWTRPWGGQGVAAVEVATGQGGAADAMDRGCRDGEVASVVDVDNVLWEGVAAVCEAVGSSYEVDRLSWKRSLPSSRAQ